MGKKKQRGRSGKKYVTPAFGNITIAGPTPSQSSGMMCANCRAMGWDTKLFMCSGCRVLWYCNRTCQLADRPTHKEACQARKALREAPMENMSSDVLFSKFAELIMDWQRPHMGQLMDAAYMALLPHKDYRRDEPHRLDTHALFVKLTPHMPADAVKPELTEMGLGYASAEIRTIEEVKAYQERCCPGAWDRELAMLDLAKGEQMEKFGRVVIGTLWIAVGLDKLPHIWVAKPLLIEQMCVDLQRFTVAYDANWTDTLRRSTTCRPVKTESDGLLLAALALKQKLGA